MQHIIATLRYQALNHTTGKRELAAYTLMFDLPEGAEPDKVLNTCQKQLASITTRCFQTDAIGNDPGWNPEEHFQELSFTVVNAVYDLT